GTERLDQLLDVDDVAAQVVDHQNAPGMCWLLEAALVRATVATTAGAPEDQSSCRGSVLRAVPVHRQGTEDGDQADAPDEHEEHGAARRAAVHELAHRRDDVAHRV